MNEILRVPGTYSFAPVWPNAKVAQTVHLSTMGRSSVAVGEAVGADPSTVRSMLRSWGVALPEGEIIVRVPLTMRTRAWLHKRAARLGIADEEWARAIMDAAIRDNLYQAIVGGEDARR